MKTILITGIGGFMGSHFLSHVLVNTDWKVIGIESFRHKGIAERITENPKYQENKDRIRIHTHDLDAPLSDVLIQSIGQVDYIVNFASLSHVQTSIENPVPFVQNNVNLILNMMEYARKAKPAKIIQIGTDETYGPTDGVHAHKEWDAIIPSNPYAASKACQEAIAISYWRTYGVPVILTNIMNNFGEMQDVEKFVPLVLRKIVKGEKITIHANKECTQAGSRFWLHPRNLADALIFILKNVTPFQYPAHDRPERFNITGEEQINNVDIAKLTAQVAGKELKYELVDAETARPGHDLHYGLDGEKLKDYGYKFPKTFKESFEKTIQWTLQHPKWLGL